MQIIPNPTLIALQMIPFVITLAALYFIIFKPMLDYLEGREKVVADDRAEAERLTAELASRMADYESRLAAAQAQATELRSRLRSEAQEAADQRITAAQKAADQRIADAVVQIQAERDAARAHLEGTARALASDITSQVLGRTVAVG